MKKVTFLLLFCLSLAAAAQSPFDEKTKAVFIFNVSQNKLLADYQSPTPKTFSLREYGKSWQDFMLFELTTLNEATGESVLYSTYTEQYMNVPANGYVGTADVDGRSILTITDTEDGHKLIKQGESIVTIMKNGFFHMLVAYNPATFSSWGKMEESTWDFVEPDDLEAYLTAHGIDPNYDPYVDPVDPDDPDDPDDPVITEKTFEDLQHLITEAHQTLRRLEGVEVIGEGIITAPEQFLSDFSDSEEGTDFSYLIDGDCSTFWHSDWHGTAPEDTPHSFVVRLPEAYKALSFLAHYTGRLDGNNCAPVEMKIYGGNNASPDLELPDNIAWQPDAFAELGVMDGLGAYAGWGHSSDPDLLSGDFLLEADDYYDALKFEVINTVTDSGYGAEPCFAYSEFQLFPTAVAPGFQPSYDKDAAEAVRQLIGEAASLDKSDDPTEMYKLLEDALANLDPTGIDLLPLTHAPLPMTLYDLTGRRVTNGRAAQGILIQAGKKVIR